ncbi:hypothetical protein ACFX16_030794 [Malus domestica]
MKVVRVFGTPTVADNASNGISRLSSPSTMTSLSPGRSSMEGDYRNGLMPLTESNNPNSRMLKKDLVGSEEFGLVGASRKFLQLVAAFDIGSVTPVVAVAREVACYKRV